MLFVLLLNLWHKFSRPSDKGVIATEVAIHAQPARISFDRYYRYAEIQDYLHKLANQYSKLVTLENYGVSYEGRNLTAIYISRNGGTNKKPILFVDAGIHAREWIAPAQGLYIINQILKNVYLINEVDWIIVPLLNPDGYEYTHTDRYWRKTRSKGKECYGVDPNRNFNHYWGGMGSSDYECSNNYAGPKPFSEPETLALSKLISKYSRQTKLYLTFHSAAQAFLFPWGYTQDLLPSNVQELRALALEAKNAVEAVNGTVYRIGSVSNIYAFTSGCSRDWAYGVAHISLAYMMELPAGDRNIFDMPPGRINSVVTEMFEAVKVFHKYIQQKFASDSTK